jgi:hypothetical protein
VRHDTYWEWSECRAALRLDEAAVAVSPSAG